MKRTTPRGGHSCHPTRPDSASFHGLCQGAAKIRFCLGLPGGQKPGAEAPCGGGRACATRTALMPGSPVDATYCRSNSKCRPACHGHFPEPPAPQFIWAFQWPLANQWGAEGLIGKSPHSRSTALRRAGPAKTSAPGAFVPFPGPQRCRAPVNAITQHGHALNLGASIFN